MTKRRMRSALRALSTALIICGTLLLADAGATLLWQEPVSALYARFQQGELQGQLDQLDRVKPTPVEQRALKKLPDPKRRLAFAARALDRKTDDGDAVGKLLIDRIGLSTVFVEGTDAGDLRAGPGHYPATPLPGQRGTVAIAGHRTTYGAPFRKIDKVRSGDEIVIVMPYGRFTYRVERKPDRAADRRLGHQPRVLRSADPLGVPPAVFGGAAHRRLRPAHPIGPARLCGVRSGDEPIDLCPRGDDEAHMTVQETRYTKRARMTGPARDGGRRFGRSSPSLPPKDGAVTKVQQLRVSIECGTYEVDSQAVAAAILKRLLLEDEGTR